MIATQGLFRIFLATPTCFAAALFYALVCASLTNADRAEAREIREETTFEQWNLDSQTFKNDEDDEETPRQEAIQYQGTNLSATGRTLLGIWKETRRFVKVLPDFFKWCKLTGADCVED